MIVFQVVNVGLISVAPSGKIERIATVYRKVYPAAKAQRLALKSSTLIPILDRICTAPDARFIHLIQQDSVYDQSITDAFFVATVF